VRARAGARHDAGDEQRRLAVLIDADNAHPSIIEALLAEIARFGVASVKRIYGDWTSTNHSQWKKNLLNHSITPVQQFSYTKGKNATDSALIIDAMDLLHTRRFDGFCLVSSDSDFTKLAQRLREDGLTVLGFGEKKTPDAFVAACDKFIYTEVLRPEGCDLAATPSPSSVVPTTAAAPTPNESQPLPIDLISQAIEEASDDSGWANLGAVGAYIQKIRPNFDPRLHGSKKLSELLRKHPKSFVVEERGAVGATGKPVYVRMNWR
jgi:uncharacterized LabA/DUF88 family protein